MMWRDLRGKETEETGSRRWFCVRKKDKSDTGDVSTKTDHSKGIEELVKRKTVTVLILFLINRGLRGG